MQKDPRFRNQTFDLASISLYLKDYADHLTTALKSIPEAHLNSAREALLKVRQQGGRIFTAGNGGSAAICEHLGCDWHKGVHYDGLSSMKVHSLVSNSALLTAISNDFGYEKSYSYQLQLMDLEPRDVVLLISSSGNSPNIVDAALYARTKGTTVIGFTGFSGGKLKEMSDVSLHVDFNNYGLVEDAHQVLMHVLAQYHDGEFRAPAERK